MLLFVVVVAVEVVVVLVVALVAEEALFVVTHTVADDEALDGALLDEDLDLDEVLFVLTLSLLLLSVCESGGCCCCGGVVAFSLIAFVLERLFTSFHMPSGSATKAAADPAPLPAEAAFLLSGVDVDLGFTLSASPLKCPASSAAPPSTCWVSALIAFTEFRAAMVEDLDCCLSCNILGTRFWGFRGIGGGGMLFSGFVAIADVRMGGGESASVCSSSFS